MMLPDMTWTPFVDVKTLAASDPGLIEKVACAIPSTPPSPGPVSTGCLAAAPVRLARVARRILRRGQPDPLDAVTPVPLEVVVLTSAQGVWHTERGPGPDGAWTPFGDVEATAAGAIGNISSKPRNVAL
jgi:hypothetical protein